MEQKELKIAHFKNFFALINEMIAEGRTNEAQTLINGFIAYELEFLIG